MNVQAINNYITDINKIYKTGKATEHSYRPALKTLLENLTTDLTITNEPKHIKCGAPDYIITRDDIPLGYIEAKDITVGLNNKANKEQFDRYKQSLNNLIITDYLTFQLFFEGHFIVSISIAEETDGVITPVKKQFDAFLDLVNKFVNFSGKTIYKSSDLAHVMAMKTRLLAEVIKTALKDKGNITQDTLSEQLAIFRTVLIHDLDVSSFADMYAQTLAYGLFAARLNQKSIEKFTRKIAAHFIPKSNPFLRKFFMNIAFELDDRICWIVDALADIFNCVAIDDIFKEFDKASQDPYIDFYETFLSEYNPSLRESRGVYYTPLPAVQFIVKAVDDILQKEFALENGLANNSKIRIPIKEPDKQGNIFVKEYREFHKVQILDPATGTGTFLAEVVNVIYSHFTNQRGKWSGYCKEHLIPRLNGFEILMASYAMAHFKLDQTLRNTGFVLDNDSNGKNNRLNIYLTNTLEDPEHEASKLPLVGWLTEEANEAYSIKKETPVMVILGNPPYSGESANFTKEEFLEAYKKEPGGIEKLKERNPKWINDDYVKFIRYGQNFIEKNGVGVLAYINNHSFLDNPTFRGMRWNLLNTYDKIYILDLHGNSKKKETSPDGSKDENVFDIQQGVSINLFIKTDSKKNGKLADIYHADLYGERKRKYIFLSEKTIDSVKWEKINPFEPFYFFTQKDFSNDEEYKNGFGIQELFPVNSVGIVTAKDSVLINDDKKLLLNNITEHYKIKPEKEFIQTIVYRPFDNQFIYYDANIVARAREKVMRHLIVGYNLGLIFKRGFTENTAPVFISKNIIDFRCWSRPGMQGGDYFVPLYLYSFDDSSERQPNLNLTIIKTIATKIGLRFIEEKIDDKKVFAPIDILEVTSKNY